MSWEQVGLITLSENWQYTDPIVGDLVRLRHITRPYGKGLIAQASQDGLEISLFDIKRVYPKDEPEIFYLIPPWGIENRKIALRQSAQYAPPWQIAIDKYVPGDSGDRLVLYADLVALVEGGGTAAELAAALALKADLSALTAGLATKANTTTVTAGLATKADLSALTAGLATKADATTVTAVLATKADASALATKADVSALTAAIAYASTFQRRRAEISSDFIGGFGEWNNSASGTGAGNSLTAITTTAPFNGCTVAGIAQHSTGTTTTGRAAITSNPTAFKLLEFIGAGSVRSVAYFRAIFHIPTLSDGTESFIYRLGFLDSDSAEPTDGCYLRIAANSSMQFVCRSNNVETTANVLTNLDASLLYNLEIIVSATNLATLSLWNSPLNTGEFGAIKKVVTVASNIPSGGDLRLTGAGSYLQKSLGVTARTINLDFMYAGVDV